MVWLLVDEFTWPLLLTLDISEIEYEEDPTKKDIELDDGQKTIEIQENSSSSPKLTASAPVDDSIDQEIRSDDDCVSKVEVITDTCINGLKDDTEIKDNKHINESSIEKNVDQTEDKDENAPLLGNDKSESDINDREEAKDFDITTKDDVSDGKDETINES